MWLAYASLAALCFGLRGILYQWTSQKPLNRNMMLLGVYISGAAVSIAAAAALEQQWSAAVWTGVIMGVFSFISNASMYKGFSVGKASLVAVFTALTPVVVAAGSFLLWGETLNTLQTLAFAVIVAGIVIIRYSNDLSWGNLQGVQWALLSMVAFGITDMAGKQAMLWEADKMPTLFVMYATGAVLFGALSAWEQLQPSASLVAAGKEGAPAVRASSLPTDAARALRVPAARAAGQWSVPRTLGWGALVGISNILGMIFILPAFELGVTGLVSAVVAANVLLILLYVRVALKEQWSGRQMIGMACTLIGIIGLKLMG